MDKYVINESSITGIADAIRNKTNSDDAMSPAEMTVKIMSIKVHEGDPVIEGVTITPTGEEIVKVPPNGVDGFGVVTVEGDPNLSPENIKEGVTIYGVEGTVVEGVDTFDATAVAADIMEGASAYVNGELVVGTHVCPEEPILSSVIATPNGVEFTLTPEDGVDGFTEVIVEGDENLSPENIKEGFSIYGVEGTMPEMKPTDIEVTSGVEDITVYPEDEYNCFDRIVVKGDSNLVPENIVKDVTIFDVTGVAESNLQVKKVEISAQ